MAKSIEEHFIDWESSAFGFGYGDGELYTLPALVEFLDACGPYGPYDFKYLETRLTPTVAWLMINALAGAGVIEYGTSPRYGWLTDEGRNLKRFVAPRTADTLYAIIHGRGDDYVPCHRDYCNCGGAEAGHLCRNPFWRAWTATAPRPEPEPAAGAGSRSSS